MGDILPFQIKIVIYSIKDDPKCFGSE